MSGIHTALLGAGAGYTITLVDQTVNNVVTSPATANARYSLESDGDIVANASTDLGDWIIPRGSAGGGFECRATVTSGSLSSGPTTYTALSSNQTWSRTRSGVGTTTCVFTLELRRVGTTAPVFSKTITLNATVDP